MNVDIAEPMVRVRKGFSSCTHPERAVGSATGVQQEKSFFYARDPVRFCPPNVTVVVPQPGHADKKTGPRLLTTRRARVYASYWQEQANMVMDVRLATRAPGTESHHQVGCGSYGSMVGLASKQGGEITCSGCLLA